MARSTSTTAKANKRNAAPGKPAPASRKAANGHKGRAAPATKGSRGKSAARKPAAGTVPAAAKSGARKRAAGRSATSAAKSTAANKRIAVRKSAQAKPVRPDKAVRKAGPARKAVKKPLSAEARKKLAGERLRALLEQKQRLAAQTPAWQQIQHHDHAPHTAEHQPHGGVPGGGGAPPHNSGHRGDS